MGTTTKPNTTELDTLRRENDELRAELAKRLPKALALPFTPHGKAYDERVLVVDRMTIYVGPAECRKITALTRGLTEVRATLANGKPVYLPNHAVQWLLEQIELVG